MFRLCKVSHISLRLLGQVMFGPCNTSFFFFFSFGIWIIWRWQSDQVFAVIENNTFSGSCGVSLIDKLKKQAPTICLGNIKVAAVVGDFLSDCRANFRRGGSHYGAVAEIGYCCQRHPYFRNPIDPWFSADKWISYAFGIYRSHPSTV